MFCKKCGAEISENTKFCAKCGTPVENVTGAQRVGGVVNSPAFVPNVGNPVPQGSTKKRTLTILKWAGAVIFAVVFIVVVVLANKMAEKKDYVEAVKTCRPFADEGLEYTYEQVLGRYITDAKWISNEIGKDGKVVIFGRAAGYDADISVTITVTRDSKLSDTGIIKPKMVEIDNEETFDENEVVSFLRILFQSYDERYEDFGDILGDDVSSEPEQREKSYDLGDRITVNETYSFNDNIYGNFEATLNYVEFSEQAPNYWDMLGRDAYADEGCVFLWANFSVENIGTKPDSFPASSCTLIYDNTYEYENYNIVDGLSSTMNPLTSPVNGSIIYMVPIEVIESGKPISIVLTLDGNTTLSYTIRQDGKPKANADSDKKVESKESAEPQESVDSGKYASVEEFLQDPLVASQLQAMMSDLDDMQLELSGDGDTLVYTFIFTEDVDAEYVAKEMLKEMNDPEFASTFEDIAGSLSEAIEVINPSVIVAYRNVDGSLICSQEYFPN